MSYYQPPGGGYQPYGNQYGANNYQQQQQQPPPAYNYGYQQPPAGMQPPAYGYQPPAPPYAQGPTGGQPPQHPQSPNISHLPEYTSQQVTLAVSFQQVVDSVASVTATNKLGYFDAPRTFNDLATVMWDTKRFSLSAGEYFTNRGEVMNVLQLKGLLPITFRGATYKTPIVAHIPNSYPTDAPILYVVPTHDLLVSPKCQFVQSDGQVTHPVLTNWNKGSTITQVFDQVALAFGQTPPLYAAPSGGAKPVQTPTNGQTFQSPTQSFSPPQTPQYSNQPTFVSPKPVESPQQIELRRRQELESMVEAKLASGQAEQYISLKGQLEKANQQKTKLNKDLCKAEFTLESGQDRLQQLKKLDGALEADCEMLKGLLAQAGDGVKSTSNDILDDNRLTMDSYTRQLILEDSLDSAIDDLLVQLDQLLDEGKISLEAYLKEVRAIARRQFMCRTLTRKVMDAM